MIKLDKIIIFALAFILMFLVCDKTLLHSKGLEFYHNDFTIIPGKRVGPIDTNTDVKEIEKIFGKENVKDTKIDDIEYSYQGTSICPNNKNEIKIRWEDEKKSKPINIYIEKEGTEWKTFRGITIGTTIDELVEINGKDILVWGCGFDYGGFVKSWQNGNLEHDHSLRHIMIQLDTSKICDYKMVGEIASNNDIIKSFSDYIRVKQIIVMIEHVN